MNTDVKILAEAMTHHHCKSLIENHTKSLRFENNHLTIYLDNAAPLHELEDEEMEGHLRSGIEKVYGEDITYELKLHHGEIPHEREKQVPHNIR